MGLFLVPSVVQQHNAEKKEKKVIMGKGRPHLKLDPYHLI